jgi:hypothetical protein
METNALVASFLALLQMAAAKSTRLVTYSRLFAEKAKEAGFPLQFGGLSQAPFDTLGISSGAPEVS